MVGDATRNCLCPPKRLLELLESPNSTDHLLANLPPQRFTNELKPRGETETRTLILRALVLLHYFNFFPQTTLSEAWAGDRRNNKLKLHHRLSFGFTNPLRKQDHLNFDPVNPVRNVGHPRHIAHSALTLVRIALVFW